MVWSCADECHILINPAVGCVSALVAAAPPRETGGCGLPTLGKISLVVTILTTKQICDKTVCVLNISD